jgi:uncharacterized protein YbcI
MADWQTKTRTELEMEINQVLIHFEKEFMGRGPLETRTYILDDFVLVRLKGVLLPSEIRLAQSDDNRGAYLLKQVRQQILDSGRPLLEAQIQDIVGVPVKSVHTDISTKTGERFIIFTLQGRPRFVGHPTDSQRFDHGLHGTHNVKIAK